MERNDRIGRAQGQWTQQHRVHDGEQRGGAADRERQLQARAEQEQRFPAEPSRRHPDITNDVAQEWRDSTGPLPTAQHHWSHHFHPLRQLEPQSACAKAVTAPVV